MLDQISAIFSFLFSLWEKLPKKIQDQIMALLVETWDHFFRMFFRQSRQEGTA